MKWFHFVPPAAVAFVALVHCSSDSQLPAASYNPDDSGVGYGTPCTTGDSRECHAVVGKHEGFVDCFDGVQQCEGGKWGPCMGSASGGGKITSKAIPPDSPWRGVQDFTGAAAAPAIVGEVHTLSLSDASTSGQPCSVNVCNPYCMGYNETPPTPVEVPPACLTTADGGVADAGPDSGDAGCVTTVSGTVFDPAGSLPLPNILVFQPAAALTALVDNGATPQCDTCASLATPAYGTVYSAVDGGFTLPIDTSGGTNNIEVVFQSGRWRRKITIPSVTACQNNPIAAGNARLPRNRTEGDIPKIAIAMASEESLECLLVKMGVSTSEIAPYQGPGDLNRIQLHRNNSGIWTVPAAPPMEGVGRLTDTPAVINSYAAVLFACGAGGDVTNNSTTVGQRANVQSYADQGGRLFINHVPGDGYIAKQPAGTNWPATATFAPVGPNTPTAVPAKGKLLSGMAGPAQLATWMALPAVGGTATYGAPYFRVGTPKKMVTAVNPATALEWTRGRDNNDWAGLPAGDYTLSYSFETPPAAATTCGRVVYTDMHVNPARGVQGMGFPAACSAAPLTEDEKVLAYMIFALTACTVGAPPVPTPVPTPTPPQPLDYSNTYDMGACPPGTKGKWTSFTYKVSTPPGTEVKFAAQTSATGNAGTWAPAAGTPAGVAIADVPLDHPGGDGAGNPSCTTTGPFPCGNNCAATIGAPMTSACPASCECPISLLPVLSTAQQLQKLQLNARLIPSSGSCAGSISPGLLTVGNNGVTTCPGAKDIQGAACDAATQYTACNQDHHCDLDAASPTYKTCIWNNGTMVWIDPNCVVGGKLGFDLTIEPPCSTNGGTSYNVPVCNRGGAAIPAGQVVNITSTVYGASCAKACAGAGAANCSFTLTAPLGPGQCVNVPPSANCDAGNGNRCLQVNPGNTVVDVNGNKECNGGAPGGSAATWTTPNGTGAGCNNNDTFSKATPFCMACSAPLTPPATPSMSSWTVSFSCVPGE